MSQLSQYIYQSIQAYELSTLAYMIKLICNLFNGVDSIGVVKNGSENMS